jgi:MinD-like ATPase involved in chromosome partitioning or flagellar assembly
MASKGPAICSLAGLFVNERPGVLQRGEVHVSEHPGHEDRSRPELPRRGYPGGPDAASGQAETKSFAGFRAERRFRDAQTRVAPARETQPEPRAWAATPDKELPQVVDPRGYGDSHYGGQPAGTAHRSTPSPSTPYPELSTHSLLRQVKPAPTEGWRRWLYVLSGQLVNVGESPRVIHYNDLLEHVNRPLRGCYRIAMLSLKGGVGKTTVTATLGATFASVRGDRVVAVDANPDRGTLSQKVPVETPATVRHVLRDADGIERYSDVRSYTSQGPSRLEVLASESDPAVSDAFSAEDYTRTLEILERFYGIVLTDCGTGLLHSAMSAVLAKADALIVVSSGSIDGVRSASATLDWLDAHGHDQLVRGSIAVINAVRPRSGKVDMQKVVDHFSRRCRAVRLVPFDPHLEEGAEVSLGQLKRSTREALIELAAVVADGFPGDERRNTGFI